MATLVASTAIDMNDPFRLSTLLSASPVSHSATQFTVQVAPIETWVFKGTSFASYTNGIPASGTVTSLTMAGGIGGVSLTGVSFSMSTLLPYLTTANTAGLNQLVFAGNDTITGSSGDDYLDGFGGNDHINGAAGVDRINVTVGADIVDGGADIDTLLYNASTSVAAVSFGLAWGAMTTSTGGVLSNGGSAKNVERFELTGGGGDDVFTVTDFSVAQTNSPIGNVGGGAGTDTLVIDASTLAAGPFGGMDFNSSPSWTMFVFTNAYDILVFNDVERLVLTGSSTSDRLTGMTGNDVIDGGAGTDSMNYAAGVESATWHRNPDASWTFTVAGLGSDTLKNIETVNFNNAALHLHIADETLFGDGTSDIIFRNAAANGATAAWGVQGSAITSQSVIGYVDATWTLAATGDFDGDGKSDLIWLHNDGVAVEWQMNGNAIANATVLGNIGTDWRFAGADDFTGDGKADLVLRSDAGAISIWSMNGATATSTAIIGYVDNTWTIAGVADLNGDGSAEILWRHDDGLVATWSTDTQHIIGTGNLGYVDTSWTLAGAGDFNDDGKSDILWVHDGDGAAVIWEMNGSSIAAAGLIGSVGSTWHVEKVGDYNGDGNADILWRNDDGTLAVWTMNGFAVNGSGVVGNVGVDWSII